MVYRQEVYLKQRDEKPEQRRAQQRRAAQKRKSIWINALGGQCVVCGDTDIRHLQIDHTNSDGYLEGRGGSHSYMLPYSRIDRSKFQVLCANHHAEKTYEEYGKGSYRRQQQHGYKVGVA